MAPRLIDHFAPGLFGRYRGHSVVHDNGEVDHYESDGSLIPLERYVGSSVIKETSGGGWRSKSGFYPTMVYSYSAFHAHSDSLACDLSRPLACVAGISEERGQSRT